MTSLSFAATTLIALILAFPRLVNASPTPPAPQAATAAELGSTTADTDNYPSRPLTLIVTFPPGGGTDLLARRLAERLSPLLGQNIVVENRTGASGNIGALAVARARADGHTLLVANSSYAINPAVYRNLEFSPRDDLTGVINVAFVPSVLVTAAKGPWQNLTQALTPRGGGLPPPAYASCGNGTPQHLAGEMLMQRTQAGWLHVPYRGCGPALVDVAAGNVALGFVTASSALPLLRAGNLRALAVTAPERSPLLPQVPTIAELGHPGYALNQWHGLLAPAATPPARIERLNQALHTVMQQADLLEGLRALGYDTTASTPEEFQKLIHEDIDRYSALADAIGLRMN